MVCIQESEIKVWVENEVEGRRAGAGDWVQQKMGRSRVPSSMILGMLAGERNMQMREGWMDGWKMMCCFLPGTKPRGVKAREDRQSTSRRPYSVIRSSSLVLGVGVGVGVGVSGCGVEWCGERLLLAPPTI